MILLTKNLIIRTLGKDDLYALAPLLADEDMMRFSLTGPLKRENEAKEFLERILDHHAKFGFGLYAIVHKESDRLIGIVGLFSQNVLGESKIELAYRLNPEFWGKGLGSEATFAVADHAFNQLNIDELISIIDPRNTRSLIFAKRLGMEFWTETTFSDIHVRIFVLNKVKVVAFNPEWKKLFSEEKIRLEKAFENSSFYHIGSTSLEAAARPVIDIIGTVPDLKQENALLETGYTLFDSHRYSRKGDKVSYNLYLYEDSDPDVEKALRFTKYLTDNPGDLLVYSVLKTSLAGKFPCSLKRYNEEKERFIKKIDIKASDAYPKKLAKKESSSKKQQWTPQEIKEAIEANMTFHMTHFAKYVENLEIRRESDVIAVLSPIQDDTFNYVLRAKFSKNNAKKRVVDTISLYADKKLQFSWWVAPSDRPDELAMHLVDSDLVFKEENIGMALNLDAFSSSKAEIAFEQVLKPHQLEEFSEILVSIGLSKEMYDKVFSKIPPGLLQKGAALELYIGKALGIPVVSGIVAFYAGAAGIYYVATTPSVRKKGFGTAMMKRLLARAQERGYHLAVLQASLDGKALYESLGFKEFSVFKEFVWK